MASLSNRDGVFNGMSSLRQAQDDTISIEKEKKMAKINFGGAWEEVVTSDEFTLGRARDLLKGETVAVLGYGVQGPGQALNLRDNGIRDRKSVV